MLETPLSQTRSGKETTLTAGKKDQMHGHNVHEVFYLNCKMASVSVGVQAFE